MNKLFIFIINLYQKTLSPDHGIIKRFFPNGYCQYYPSCSQYSKEAFAQYSFLKALTKSIFRIVRCNPWSNGGLDPIIK
jgi:putative membrane protein insertion efficiency factor